MIRPATARALSGLAVVVLSAGLQACGGPADPSDAALPAFADVVMLGGATTDVSVANSSFAFSSPAVNLSADNLALHLVGDGDFDRSFVPYGEPGAQRAGGLGPVFNHSSCNACHANDGRGTPPASSLEFRSFTQNEATLLRISLDSGDPRNCQPSAANEFCNAVAVPGFGRQLLHRGVFDARPDSPFVGQAQVFVRYETSAVTYPDGASVELRRPHFEIRNAYDGAASRLLRPDVRISPRMSMPVFGLGLLEAIRESDIVALADPGDADRDGISGRPNYVFDPLKAHENDPNPVSLGRFGWKAGEPNLVSQAAAAMVNDMGVTNPIFPDEAVAGTSLYTEYVKRHPRDSTRPGGGTDADDAFLAAVTFYVQSLAVPGRRDVENASVRAGAALFESTGCVACHQPRFLTGTHPEGINELSGQEIWPFTDMLLHDMGPELADGRSDFLADGQEWRTRPLWGLGRTRAVNPLAGLLHDGRARTVEEAILWHGGEAAGVRERFRALGTSDRAALLAFLDSL